MTMVRWLMSGNNTTGDPQLWKLQIIVGEFGNQICHGDEIGQATRKRQALPLFA